jgi:hypothetical protein
MVEKEIRVYTGDVEMTTLVVRPIGGGPCRSRWSICTGVAMKQDATASLVTANITRLRQGAIPALACAPTALG